MSLDCSRMLIIIRLSCATGKGKTSNPEILARSIQNRKREARKVSTLFSSSSRAVRDPSVICHEKKKGRSEEEGEARRRKKRSRLMEKIRKQQENKQSGCSRRDAFALKCPKLMAFTFSSVFLPFLAREARQNGH